MALQRLDPVEVRAVRAGSNAPFAKTDIGARDIQKANLGQDLPYLLQYTPSAVVTSDAGTGVGYTGLRIRGTDGTRINVTLNGVPMNDGESQGTYFVDFADMASSTNSIQIQRGVGTSTNGSGAFGATLSVDNLAQRDTVGADVTVTAGSFNTQRYTLRGGTGLLPGGFRFDARLSKIHSDGFINRASSDLRSAQIIGSWQNRATRIRAMVMTGLERTYQAWNGIPEEKLRGNDSALAAHYAGNLGSLYFTPADSANLYGSDPRRYNGFTYSNQTDNYQQDYYQLHLDHRFSSRLQMHAAGFYTRGKGFYEEYKPQQKYKSYGLAPVVAGTDTIATTDLIRQLWLDNHFYGGVFSLLYEQGKTAFTFGGAATQYIGGHYGYIKWAQQGGVDPDYRWYKLDAQKNDFNAYLKAQQGIGENLTLFAEMQGRTVTHFMNGFRKAPGRAPAVEYNFFNPKGGFSYFLQHTASAAQRIYGSVAVAHREPNRNDFEDRSSTSADPKPERLIDWEAGYELRRQKWTVGINAFYMNYKDQLVVTGQVNDVGEYTRTNVPQSYRRGVELQGAWMPKRKLSFFGNLTLSQNKVVDFTEYVYNYDNDQQEASFKGNTDLAFSPSVIGSVGLTVRPVAGLEVDVLGKGVGRQYLDNTQTDSRSIDPYQLLDLRFRYSLKMRRGPSATFNLQLANLLNRKYESNGYTYSYIYGATRYDSNWYYPQAGFNVLGGVTVRF